MDDLISRQAAIEALYDGAYLSFEKRNELIDRMNRIPTAEPVCNIPLRNGKSMTDIVHMFGGEVDLGEPPTAEKKGKWIHRKNWSMYVCDQCSFENRDESRYCPNCGARMDGGEE